ncbi:MAG: hypothetical protein IJ746_00615 [Ruminococcus sp.]|nr:hypothetical protein [Ruminococcus sp.]
MKKIASMALALVLCLGIVSCGDSDPSAADTSKADSAAPSDTASEAEADPAEDTTTTTTTTAAEPEVPLNTNVVHKDFTNPPAGITASFDVANIDGFETNEGEQHENLYRADGRYGYLDPDWYSNAITIDYIVQPISAYYLEMLAEKKEVFDNYDKTDLGSAYDTYVYKQESSYGYTYNIVFVGGSYLDGTTSMTATITPQLDSGKPEDIDLIVDTLARSLKLEGDASALQQGDSFSLAQGGVTVKNKATIVGVEVDMEEWVFTNSAFLSAKTSFEADGIGYEFHTGYVDEMRNFGKMGGGEYKDAEFAGKPGKIKVTPGVGTVEVIADVQIDDSNVLHMTLSSDSALQQGELSDSVKLGEKFAEMLSDDNIEATTEIFAGYINDIVSSAITF